MAVGVYERTAYHLQLLASARANIVRRPLSDEAKRKIGLANRGLWIEFACDWCGILREQKQSHYKRSTRHFCNKLCYDRYKTTIPKEQHPRWQGIGTDKQNYHRRYVEKHPERIAHLKSRRYARERNAEGTHTLEEWLQLKARFNNQCVHCGGTKPLTKDHIIPLSEGGSDYITNIQPLCRNCNSRKWKFIYEHPHLLEEAK